VIPFEFRRDLWQQKTESLGYRVVLLVHDSNHITDYTFINIIIMQKKL